MTLDYHPAVQQDFNTSVSHYTREGGDILAARFEEELRNAITAIRTDSRRFAHYRGHLFFRRIRLDRFPYLIVHREMAGGIRVLLLVHERRHPRYGATRW